MNFIPLIDFVRINGQQKTAEMLGCTQGYISRSISEHRAVYIRQLSTNEAEAVELKRFANSRERSLETANRLNAIGQSLVAAA